MLLYLRYTEARTEGRLLKYTDTSEKGNNTSEKEITIHQEEKHVLYKMRKSVKGQ